MKKRLAIFQFLFISSCIGLISILVLDMMYWQTGILSEGWPDFSIGHLLRSVLILVFVSMLIVSVLVKNQSKLDIAIWKGKSFEQVSTLGTFLISIILLGLFLVEPPFFTSLCKEDGIFEWGSAILLVSSSAIFFVKLVNTYTNVGVAKIFQFTYFIFSLLFFLIAMEEISWFQRILVIETPSSMAGNLQDELNLHNFATDQIENIYYFGTFLFLVVLPFLNILHPSIRCDSYLNHFIPHPYISIIGGVACAYNFDMWNILFTQMAFFGSTIILLAFVILVGEWNKRGFFLFSVFIIVITQVLFLTNGENFSRLWDVTEYKEFFIPLAFFVYSISVYKNKASLLPNES